LPVFGDVIVFVLPYNLPSDPWPYKFDPDFKQAIMNQKERKPQEEIKQVESELEDVKRKLKKKELQNSILKKIIGQNDDTGRQSEHL
jgi:hypothetical protein